MKICVCGGGALGHVISGVLAEKGLTVSLLTGRPKKWATDITITLPDHTIKRGRLARISSDPAMVITDADYVIFCLPGFLIAQTLRKISPYLKESTVIGSVVSSNGFFWMAKHILPRSNTYFGLQRVPFIARVKEYGLSAELKGFKKLLKVAVSNKDRESEVRANLELFFGTPLELLNSFWPATLTNSNPLLHTARLFVLFKNYVPGTIYEVEPLFYEQWDNESSELLISCDEEFQRIISFLPVRQGDIPSIKQYYEANDALSLTKKLQSIEAFKGIRLQMKKVEGGYVPDWNNRYFTEDIPYGLLIIKDFAEFLDIPVPNIDKILLWAQDRMNKEYLVDGSLKGKDLLDSGIPRNYMNTINELLFE